MSGAHDLSGGAIATPARAQCQAQGLITPRHQPKRRVNAAANHMKGFFMTTSSYAALAALLASVLGTIFQHFGIHLSSDDNGQLQTLLIGVFTIIAAIVSFAGHIAKDSGNTGDSSLKVKTQAGSGSASASAILLAIGLGLTAIAGGPVGCGNIAPPSVAYLASDQSTFTAIAPRYLYYVGSDASLSAAEQQSHLTTVQSWANRLSAAGAPTTMPTTFPASP